MYAHGMIWPRKSSNTTNTISDLWSEQYSENSLQNRCCPLALRVLEQLSSCRLFLIWVSRQIFPKRVAVLSSKSLLLQSFTPNGLKTICTDITKGAFNADYHFGSPTAVHSSLCSDFVGLFSFFLLNYLAGNCNTNFRHITLCSYELLFSCLSAELQNTPLSPWAVKSFSGAESALQVSGGRMAQDIPEISIT